MEAALSRALDSRAAPEGPDCSGPGLSFVKYS